METGQIIELGSLLLAWISGLAITVWRLLGAIQTVDEKRSKGVHDLHEKVDSTAMSLDQKFNVVRDEISSVKDNYVRRDDLNAHLGRFERNQEQQTAAIDRLRNRFDEWSLELLHALSGKKTDG